MFQFLLLLTSTFCFQSEKVFKIKSETFLPNLLRHQNTRKTCASVSLQPLTLTHVTSFWVVRDSWRKLQFSSAGGRVYSSHSRSPVETSAADRRSLVARVVGLAQTATLLLMHICKTFGGFLFVDLKRAEDLSALIYFRAGNYFIWLIATLPPAISKLHLLLILLFSRFWSGLKLKLRLLKQKKKKSKKRTKFLCGKTNYFRRIIEEI